MTSLSQYKAPFELYIKCPVRVNQMKWNVLTAWLVMIGQHNSADGPECHTEEASQMHGRLSEEEKTPASFATASQFI